MNAAPIIHIYLNIYNIIYIIVFHITPTSMNAAPSTHIHIKYTYT